jgi:hypothetical protein
MWRCPPLCVTSSKAPSWIARSCSRRSGAAAFYLTWVTGARRSGNYAASFREMVVA